MDEMNDVGFEDFEAALFADDYQNDSDSDTEETETTQDATEDGSEEPSDGEATETTGDESSEDENTDDSEESGADGDSEASDGTQSAETAQTFTIKVNKEERKVTLEEMTAFAQKGADYDRVKEQNTRLQQSNTELQTKLDGITAQQGVLDVLSIIANKSGSTLEQLAESLYVNFRKSAGASEDVAREELKNAKLEKELNGFKAQQTQKQEQETSAETRAQRDLEDFARDYPDVKLEKELLDKLVPDIQSGMSLSAAYRKLERSQEKERIAELERQLAAERQNAKNKRNTPGSQKDSGGRRKADDAAIFEKALFG